MREHAKILGNLTADFDLSRARRRPVLLPVHPATTLTGTPAAPPAFPRPGGG